MTKNEIVQSLRGCFGLGGCSGCAAREAVAHDPLPCKMSCKETLGLCAADLIEQQAERIEELEKSVAVFGQANKALREKLPEWISVEDADRLPPPGKRVIATDGVFVGEAYRTGADTWRRYDGIAMLDCLGGAVTHWMLLPKPPKDSH